MRIAILFFGLLCMCLSIQAQSDSIQKKKENHKRWKQGFVVSLRGDTTCGKIRVTNMMNAFFYDFQDEVSFDDAKGVTFKYTPDELKSFSYYTDDEAGIDTTTLVSIINPKDPQSRAFCKIYIDGPCKKYGYYITNVSGGAPMMGAGGMMMGGGPSASRRELFYVQIGKSDLIQVKLIGFKKTMRKVFSDCPLILAKLESGAIDFYNWEAAVYAYNKGICK